jgi:hypothetical protein
MRSARNPLICHMPPLRMLEKLRDPRETCVISVFPWVVEDARACADITSCRSNLSTFCAHRVPCFCRGRLPPVPCTDSYHVPSGLSNRSSCRFGRSSGREHPQRYVCSEGLALQARSRADTELLRPGRGLSTPNPGAMRHAKSLSVRIQRSGVMRRSPRARPAPFNAVHQ